MAMLVAALDDTRAFARYIEYSDAIAIASKPTLKNAKYSTAVDGQEMFWNSFFMVTARRQ